MIKKIFGGFKIWLFIIVVLAGILRFYQVDKVPVSLYWDEVSQGYNAYSISQTLRDEYGKFLPILFRAYDDYKMPLNVYLTAISVGLFGLNEFAVRFPSALLGTLTVLVTFFLVKMFLEKSNWETGEKYKNQIGLLSAFFLSISPWHIQFSRAGFEANVALFFIILGVYLFLKGLEKYRYYLFSFIFFAVACYGYRSVEIFLPVLLLGFFVGFRKELSKIGLIKLGLGLVFFAILIFPLVGPLTKEGSSRLNQTSITIAVNETAAVNFQKGIPTNRKVIYAGIFLQDYLSQFTPQFLFTGGDPNGRHSPRGMGMMYLWELPFLLLGLYVVFKYFSSPSKISLLIWLLAAPLPSAISIPTPHALRTLNILPVPQIIVSIGVAYLFFVLDKNVKKIYAAVLALLIIFFFVRFIGLYNFTNTKSNVADWADGYKQLTGYVFANDSTYDKVLISGHYWEPYAYFLFYKRFDPKAYQTLGTSNGFGKYVFGGTSWDKDKNSQELGDINLRKYAKTSSRLLVALSPQEYDKQKQNISELTQIKDHNNQIIFVVGKVK
jgi:4-amino-4-deoxy-L-arabinose transferase-like glycosyltransferase